MTIINSKNDPTKESEIKHLNFFLECEQNKNGSQSNSPNEFFNNSDVYEKMLGKYMFYSINSKNIYNSEKLNEMEKRFNNTKNEQVHIKDKMHFYFFTGNVNQIY